MLDALGQAVLPGLARSPMAGTEAGWAIMVPAVLCAVAYVVLTVLILVQARRSRTGILLSVAAMVTAAWAGTTALSLDPLRGAAGMLDLLRMIAWYGFCLHLYRRTLAAGAGEQLFTLLGLGALAAIAAELATGAGDIGDSVTLATPGLSLRLALAIVQLLLLENLYRRTAAERGWHMGLACITLSGVAAYEIIVCADAVLLRSPSAVLVAGRPLVAALATPLLIVAAARNRNWQVNLHVSRSAVLHTASLVLSGIFLLALAAAGQLARRLGAPQAGWGSVVEIGLMFSGVLTAAVLLTSGTARGWLRGRLVDHFFTHRYDHRLEWQRCIAILAAPADASADEGELQRRVIRALADPVDSPSGLLFTREPGQAGFSWAGAWKVAPAVLPPETSPLTQAIYAARTPLLLEPLLDPEHSSFGPNFQPWIAVPLADPAEPDQQMGCIVLARPRAAFTLDDEVFDLLRILAHEVAVHLAQDRATHALLQARDLRAYGERFAFVAHDIKNVASQLQLLLSNADAHLSDPAFQQDMLETVRASVRRIGGLIRRLESTQERTAQTTTELLDPGPLLDALAAARLRAGWGQLTIAPGTTTPGLARIAMDKAAFQAAVTHLLDNAAAAAGATGTVRLALRVDQSRVVIDIADDGPGMTPEFIRDELFTPFATRTQGGSGLGAFQARELLRAAGGDIAVLSQPGSGTTMRLSLPLAEPSLHPAATSLDPATHHPKPVRPIAGLRLQSSGT